MAGVVKPGQGMIKTWIKWAVARTPYRVIRARDGNRFQAIDEVLASLAGRGYKPRIVLDGGANVGDFGKLCRRIFGRDVVVEMFEPQPACSPALESLSREHNFHFHPAALGSKDDTSVSLAIDPSGAVTTGAHVALDGQPSPSVCVPVVTLDSMFQSSLETSDRSLLKLDLQGWELEALRGAIRTLSAVEVVLLEVSFFAQAYEPPIASLFKFLDESGFELYDIASLSARSRDNRARQADFVFVNKRSSLTADVAWG